MRYPDDHKEATRARIVAAASEALRQYGLTGVSITALMKKVGLTHGGFYVHFADRDALVAEAVASAAADTGKRVFSDSPNTLTMLQAYLSKEHLDHPEKGCVLAALGTDAPKQSAPVRSSFAEAARGFLQLVQEKLHPQCPAEEPSADTLETASRMIGALVLGRLVDDDDLAEKILATAREHCPR